ncbi:MAG: flavodoxin family protein [Fretibacterium sp.]
MKALFVNGSPRKNWNTHKMLESAMEGAREAGAEAELAHLYDAVFKGCVSCFACKVKNSRTNGLCALRDPLTPTLEKARDADVIVIGSPVYLHCPTASTRAFLERLMFPLLVYGIEERTILKKAVPTAMVYTMNCPEGLAERFHYPTLLGANADALRLTFGYSETLCAYDTYQFGDYSRYEVTLFNEKDKARQREEQFPKDLQSARELGKRLVEKAASRAEPGAE